MEITHGLPTHFIENKQLSVGITPQGGMVAPVIFRMKGREHSPYSLSPWKPDEAGEDLPPLLRNLRGDFLCLPFGPQKEGPPHGETANADWNILSASETELALGIRTRDTGAHVEKTVSIRGEQTNIYYEHRISMLEGDFNYGNHPILDLSSLEAGAARVSVSPFRWASVYPGVFSDPADGARQILARGAVFTDLREVPLMEGGTIDLSHYPTSADHDDLVMMVSEITTPEQPFAWTAIAMEGCVWFSLKNPADFPSTLFWLSNAGRSAAPWNSVHRGRIGVEDVCSHFSDDVETSRKALLSDKGIPTTRHFRKDETVTLRNIQCMAETPEGFGRVASIRPDGEGYVRIEDEDGNRFRFAVDWAWL